MTQPVYTKGRALEELKQLVGQFGEAVDRIRTGHYMKEAQVEDTYIKPLFRLLNWNTSNRDLAPGREEFIVQASLPMGKTTKEPDYLLQTPDPKTGRMKRWLFIEAKHPKYDLSTNTTYIRQAYQYAHSTLASSDDPHNQVRLALLTDFEEFRLFDCWDSTPLERGNASLLNQYVVRPFDMTWGNYVDDFDLLWDAFERNQVAKGSLTSLVVTREDRISRRVGPDERFLSDLERWREGIAQSMWRLAPTSSGQLLTAAAQLMIDRLVFVKMLSDREIEKDYLDDLRSRLAKADQDRGSVSMYDACQDIFRQLDRTYNGAIFARRPELDSVAVENEVMRRLLDDMAPDNATYTLAAMPVEIVGHAYERFLGKTIRSTEVGVVVEEKPEVRKAGGVYYTPRYIVDHIVEQTVGELLKGCQAPEDVAKLRILDPACGSGSFLIGAYAALLRWHERFFEKDAARMRGENRNTLVSPKYKDFAQVFVYGEDSDRFRVRLTTKLRKQILLNNIFGVDIDPQAVEVAQFSLSMKAVEGATRTELRQDVDLFHSTVLPDLSANIRCGNSLVSSHAAGLVPVAELTTLRPFDWLGQDGFKAVFEEGGGFSAIIGNPPYVSIQHLRKWSPIQASILKQNFMALRVGNGDIYLAFIEEVVRRLAPTGRAGLIVPNKFMATDYGADLRDMLTKNRLVDSLVDFGHGQVFSNATTYTCLLFLSHLSHDAVRYGVSRPGHSVMVANERSVPYDGLGRNVWSFSDEDQTSIINRMREGGHTLGTIGVKISRGSSTGADQVFFLRKSNGLFLAKDGEALDIAPECLRVPVGARDFDRYEFRTPIDRHVIFPYAMGNDGKYRLVDEGRLGQWGVLDYLKRHRSELESRKQFSSWYGYSAPRSLDVHERADLLVPLLADRGRCCSLPEGGSRFLLMASGGFSITADGQGGLDAAILLALLNSRAAFWFLRQISNKFRGGWITCTKQYVAQIPVPKMCIADGAGDSELLRLKAATVRLLGIKEAAASASALHDGRALQSAAGSLETEIDEIIYSMYGLDSCMRISVERELDTASKAG